MSITIAFNGTNYTFPSTGETDWANQLQTLIQALAANTATLSTAQTLSNKTLTGTTTLAPAILMFGIGSTPINTSTNFLRPGFITGAADTTEIKMVIPVAGKLSNLYVVAGTAAVGGTTTVQVRLNGIPRTLTISNIPAGTATASQTGFSFVVAAGDQLSISITHGAGISTGMTNVLASLLLTQA